MSKKENIPETPSSTTNYAPPSTGGDGGGFHGECCEECKRTCKRNFWTEVLRTVVKIGTAVLAALGLAKSGGLPED